MRFFKYVLAILVLFSNFNTIAPAHVTTARRALPALGALATSNFGTNASARLYHTGVLASLVQPKMVSNGTLNGSLWSKLAVNQASLSTYATIAQRLYSTSGLRAMPADLNPALVTPELAPESASLDNGPLAKIALLQNSLTTWPRCGQKSSLLHGAHLWENNTVAGLYSLLVVCTEQEVNDQIRRVASPEQTVEPLGLLLTQLFYRAGNTTSVTNSKSMPAYYLNPTQLGQIYGATFEILAQAELIKACKPKKMSWPQFNKLHDSLLSIFGNSDASNSAQQDLARALLMAFFWTKFINNSSVPTSQAQRNIAEFKAGFASIGVIGSDESAIVGSGLRDIEAHIIEHIGHAYSANLPKPPAQGYVDISNSRHFPDCGESGLRGLFYAAFYDYQTKKFNLPADASAHYDAGLISFFTKYPDLAAQETREARNDWGKLLSGRKGVKYGQSFLLSGYDLACNFTNVMSMLAQLAPSCFVEFTVQTGAVVDCSPAAIQAYFANHPEQAQSFLNLFALTHGLKLLNFSSRLLSDSATFEIYTSGSASSLIFNTKSGHMDCHLKLSARKELPQTNDPLIDCTNLQEANPLVFAAYELANYNYFNNGYLALIPIKTRHEILNIAQNLKQWGLLRPQDSDLINDLEQTILLLDDQKLHYVADKIIKENLDPYRNRLLHLIISMSDYVNKKEAIERVLALGIDINATDAAGRNVLHRCKDIFEIKLLLEQGACSTVTDRYGNTVLHAYCGRSHNNVDIDVVKLYLELGLDLHAKNINGKTAFDLATPKMQLQILEFLLTRSSKLPYLSSFNATRILERACYEDSSLKLIDYLLDKGARVEGEGINYSGGNYINCLAAAISGKQTPILAHLLQRGVNPNGAVYDTNTNYTGLMLASATGNVAAMKLLLDYGADVNAKTSYGKTALELACSNDKLDAAKLLLEYGDIKYILKQHRYYRDEINELLRKYQKPITERAQIALSDLAASWQAKLKLVLWGKAA